jgi:hypothetical protein
MQKNKLRLAIRATAALAVIGLSGQASAMKIVGDADHMIDLKGYEIDVYGYARLNASYDIDEDIASSTRSGSFAAVNTGAAEDNEATGFFGADAFQSRFGVQAVTPQGVKVVVEGDFRGSGGGELRIRHAYGEYKGVMAGRNWSNYVSFVGFVPTLEFDGMPGNAGSQFRTSQLRYTSGPVSVSLEQPFNFAGFANDPAIEQKTSLPIVTARLEDSAGAISYSTAAFLRQINYDTGTQDDSELSYGAFGALTAAVTDTVSLYGVVNYVNGGDIYLYRSGENYAAEYGYVDSSGSIELISGYSASVGASFDLGGGRSINTGVGMVETDWDDALRDLPGSAGIGDKHETNTMAMINYKWSPVKAVTMGVEYGYFKVDEVDGDDGDASRILFAAQYSF